MHDVVIVGAGPGGLNCAYHLQKTGLDVVVLEKNKKVGPKICAAGLTKIDVEELGIPKKLLEQEFTKANADLPTGKYSVTSDKPFLWTFEREKLGQWQLKRLKKGTVKTNSCVTEIYENHVIANDEKLEFRHLVGADGSASIVRKHLGLPFKLYQTLHYNIKGEYPLTCAIDYKKIKSSYMWIFPHIGYASVGAGCDPREMDILTLKKEFHKWMDRINLDYTTSELESFPILHNYKGFKFNNTYLVGDAAGLASVMTGEGVYQAMISGEEVANVIIDPNHRTEKIDKLLKRKKTHARMMWMWRNIPPLRRLAYWGVKKFQNNYKVKRYLYYLLCS